MAKQRKGKWISCVEAGELAGCHHRTIRRMAYAGEIGCRYVGPRGVLQVWSLDVPDYKVKD